MPSLILAAVTGFCPLCTLCMDQTPPGAEPLRQLRLTDASFDHCHHLPGIAPGLPWNPGATDHGDYQPRRGGDLQPTPGTSGQGPAGGSADLASELRERPGHLRGRSLRPVMCCASERSRVLHQVLFAQIRSIDCLNPPSLMGLARSRFRRVPMIHQTWRPPNASATRPSWRNPQFMFCFFYRLLTMNWSQNCILPIHLFWVLIRLMQR